VTGRHRFRVWPWVVSVVLVATMLVLLAVNGVLTTPPGADAVGRPVGAMDRVPVQVPEGGSVLDATHSPVRSLVYPARTVALTFDDGPDPQWTPQILAVLRKHQVPGTFFVLGGKVVRHPGLVRDIRASGSQVGLHTFTHPDLGAVSPARASRELSESQIALAGATGEISYLVRPPYSSGVSSVDNQQLQVLAELGRHGYVTALSDVDSRDWEHTDPAAIVAAAIPRTGAGGAVLLHDSGGNRAATVAALDRLIPELKTRGYRFTTVTDAVNLPPATTPAVLGDRIAGQILIATAWLSTTTFDVLNGMLFVVGALVAARLLVMIVVAGRHARRARPTAATPRQPYRGRVSVVVPAYNEKETIAATVRSLAASEHPVEIIVVDDGSTDGTGEIVEGLRIPNVRVIRQRNAGKPAALNTGIRAARHEIIVMIDGDTLFEPQTITYLVQPFTRAEVGAVAGNAKVANRKGLLARWQHLEYVIGFNLDRRVFDTWRCMTTVPGAIGAFRRTALLEVGGVSDDTLAEDTDLTMAICRAGWRIVYEERAHAWTEVPTTFGQLSRQRYRWSYGTMQSMWKHRRSVVQTGPAGRFGRVGLVNVALFQIVLPLLAPVVDLMLIYGLLFQDPVRAVLPWLGMLAVQMIGAAYAFRLEREKLGVLWLLPLQQFVYRQLMYTVLLRSIHAALAGIRLRWQKLRRTGDFAGAPPTVRQTAVEGQGVRPDPAPMWAPTQLVRPGA
jgi:peptidoglycan/xylan/chitin deacetylase (PgdA/CDA1 family)/glycosyltransferase involved in cell wall biosynthesis